jgi:hypothetical protein
MNPLIIGPIFELGKSLLDRFFPDPAEKAKAELELVQLMQGNDLKLILAQIEVNAKEAAHPSIWVSGWRPAVGWIGAAALAFSSILYPLLVWVAAAKGWNAPPKLDTEVVEYLLYGMLGIGGLRTLEKVRNVATK